MKLIFVNRFFYPDHSATAQILSDLCFALADKGHHIHVICSHSGYDGGSENLPDKEMVKGVIVHRLKTTRFGRVRALGKICDYISFYFLALIYLWKLVRAGDVVIAKSDPPLLSVFIGPLVAFKKAKLVNWLQDMFPEVATRLEFGGKLVGGAFYLLRIIRNWSLSYAEINVVPGQLMADYLSEQGIARDHVYVLPNWADGEEVYAVARQQNRLREEWGLEGKFVVGYSGNFGRAHDFETILRAARILYERDCKNVVFLFIGGGAQHHYIQERMQLEGIGNIFLKPYQPRNQLSQSLSASDIHLISLHQELEGLLLPCKFYGIAAAGRATLFIGAPDGEIPHLLAKHNIGETVTEGDVEKLASTILNLSQNPDYCQAMGHRARNAFNLSYDKKIGVKKWEILLENIGASRC